MVYIWHKVCFPCFWRIQQLIFLRYIETQNFACVLSWSVRLWIKFTGLWVQYNGEVCVCICVNLLSLSYLEVMWMTVWSYEMKILQENSSSNADIMWIVSTAFMFMYLGLGIDRRCFQWYSTPSVIVYMLKNSWQENSMKYCWVDSWN
jgi:hypothetical protein